MRVLCIILAVFFSINCVGAYVTDDSRIVAAAKILDLQTLEQLKTTQILFYELGFISYEYKDHYALTTEDNEIIINAKYRNAPPQVLAALIAHESVHLNAKSDLQEELRATIAEIKQWDKNPHLNSEHPLVLRLNNLSQLYENGGPAAIRKKIKDNEAYERL